MAYNIGADIGFSLFGLSALLFRGGLALPKQLQPFQLVLH